jgi:hypothetical protein
VRFTEMGRYSRPSAHNTAAVNCLPLGVGAKLSRVQPRVAYGAAMDPQGEALYDTLCLLALMSTS